MQKVQGTQKIITPDCLTEPSVGRIIHFMFLRTTIAMHACCTEQSKDHHEIKGSQSQGTESHKSPMAKVLARHGIAIFRPRLSAAFGFCSLAGQYQPRCCLQNERRSVISVMEEGLQKQQVAK